MKRVNFANHTPRHIKPESSLINIEANNAKDGVVNSFTLDYPLSPSGSSNAGSSCSLSRQIADLKPIKFRFNKLWLVLNKINLPSKSLAASSRSHAPFDHLNRFAGVVRKHMNQMKPSRVGSFDVDGSDVLSADGDNERCLKFSACKGTCRRHVPFLSGLCIGTRLKCIDSSASNLLIDWRGFLLLIKHQSSGDESVHVHDVYRYCAVITWR